MTDRIVSLGLRFLQEITAHYGGEVSSDIFDKMKESLPGEIVDSMFKNMMVGPSRYVTVFYNPLIETDLITSIKALRTVTSMGLKETKDIVDKIRYCRGSHTIDLAEVGLEYEILVRRTGGWSEIDYLRYVGLTVEG